MRGAVAGATVAGTGEGGDHALPRGSPPGSAADGSGRHPEGR
ncbi:hypothetical protein MINT15_31530 [Saccharomonospora viridis]|uniref:Uncharacterized protein n=1 Tax=Saccharomonospora viridis TaxID=1852 RepID=A0A837D8P8_9PSEU|nr:hypothetical protein MINT15_31530 [Saccharomonospora viridis]